MKYSRLTFIDISGIKIGIHNSNAGSTKTKKVLVSTALAKFRYIFKSSIAMCLKTYPYGPSKFKASLKISEEVDNGVVCNV